MYSKAQLRERELPCVLFSFSHSLKPQTSGKVCIVSLGLPCFKGFHLQTSNTTSGQPFSWGFWETYFITFNCRNVIYCVWQRYLSAVLTVRIGFCLLSACQILQDFKDLKTTVELRCISQLLYAGFVTHRCNLTEQQQGAYEDCFEAVSC